MKLGQKIPRQMRIKRYKLLISNSPETSSDGNSARGKNNERASEKIVEKFKDDPTIPAGFQAVRELPFDFLEIFVFFIYFLFISFILRE